MNDLARANAFVVDLPGSADLVRACTEAKKRVNGGHPILDVAAQLASQHRVQWSAEDDIRDHPHDDHTVAEAKRQIDALNLVRIELVDQIDCWAERSLDGDPTASLHTETLGQITDRLAIAWVRSAQLGALAGRDPDRRDDARRALTLLAQLCDAYDDLVRDLRAGRRRLPAWRGLKRYGTRP